MGNSSTGLVSAGWSCRVVLVTCHVVICLCPLVARLLKLFSDERIRRKYCEETIEDMVHDACMLPPFMHGSCTFLCVHV